MDVVLDDFADLSGWLAVKSGLVHLGERAAANELADFLLGDRRPLAWNQWPDISWRDPRSPGHIGDVPPAWIGAEYVLPFRTMPPGGIVLRPPLPGRLVGVQVDGVPVDDFLPDEVTLRAYPLDVVLRYRSER
jgi:hypothetical protein